MRSTPDRVGLDNFIAGEKLRNFLSRGFRRIRAVHRIFANRFGVLLANGAGCGLGRIGRAHDVAISSHGIFSFKHLNHHRP